jgi:hypothetical protein
MTDEKHQHEGQSGMPAKNPGKEDPKKNPRQDPRQDRLKLALRENLKRRKSQARGRSGDTSASSNRDEASLHEDGDKKPGE